MVKIEKDGITADVPDNLKYGKSHVWAKDEAGVVTIGITDYGQKSLKEIVLVDIMVGEGDEVSGSPDEQPSVDPFASLESTKAVAEIFALANGSVTAVNTELDDDPTIVNQDPYGKGWIIKVKGSLVGGVLDAAAYANFVKSS
ncbi:MAG: glycine cleavage system protein H [Candidatus Lokiarchaeota archaeon]|nr:glycine cleavage system protein H [Candidatus Lokiarchaeota archaeon]